MKFILLIGRILFSLIFISSGIMAHLMMASQTADYAAKAGVPMPLAMVVISGLFALLGGLSILLGYKAKTGALFIVIFLLGVTFKMHNFWAVTDQSMQMIQMSMFMKNLALLGGALIITYFGAGPVSLDALAQQKKQNKDTKHSDTKHATKA